MWSPPQPVDYQLVCTAHSKGVRVVSITGMTTTQLHNETYVDEWVKQNVLYVQQNFLGIYFRFFRLSVLVINTYSKFSVLYNLHSNFSLLI